MLLAAGGVVLLLATSLGANGWLRWLGGLDVRRWLGTYGVVVAGFAAGLVLLVAAGLERQRSRRPAGARRAPLSWWVIAGGAVLVVAVAWAATAWLLHEASGAHDPAAARVDAVKTGLAIGAGTGGVLALLLAVRRQWHQEITSLDTTHDATERRVTELYTKAAEQLGSDKAPVRMAGLYALERLAQDHLSQRQTIVNVLCAYLRMPCTVPAATAPDGESGATADKDELRTYREAVQEKEVRLAAQRLLADHLRPGPEPGNPAPTYWAEIDLDLTGATLIAFNLASCTTGAAVFKSATFVDVADFGTTTFTGNADFRTAAFTSTADFKSATFVDVADFETATFTGYAPFGEVTFHGSARFRAATFRSTATFWSTTFTSTADFRSATFIDVNFGAATFTGTTGFGATNFGGRPDFGSATFVGEIPVEVKSFGASRQRVEVPRT